MNICILTSSFPSHPGDVVQAPFLFDFIGGLRKRGHRAFVFTQEREGSPMDSFEGVRVQRFSWMGSKKALVHLNPLNPLDLLRIGSLLYRGRKAVHTFVKENAIDACLALWVLPSGYFANRIYRQTGIPYSVWALGSDIYRYGRNPFVFRVMKRIIRDATGVFADGFDLARRVEKRFKKKCFFLATTRTIPFPSPPLREDSEGSRGKTYRFLFVGRLEKVKGIDVLLQSMELLAEQKLDASLAVVGRGRMEGWAANFINQRNLRERISLLGNVSDQALARVYASSDCVVIPSRSESIPLVFSEALEFDKEMVVTDVGDMGMLARQYGVARVVPPDDPLALMGVMREKIESSGREKPEDAENRRRELKRLFDIEGSVDRFLADYKQPG